MTALGLQHPTESLPKAAWCPLRRQARAQVLRLQLRLPALLLQLRRTRLVVLLQQAPAPAHPDLRMPVRSGHAHCRRRGAHHLVLPGSLPRLSHVVSAKACFI